MVERSDWNGLLANRDPGQIPSINTVVKTADKGGSGSFQAICGSDRLWVKALNNPQSSRVPVNEFIVASVGTLVGAPVCDVRLVAIPKDLEGTEIRPGYTLEEGIASGSLEVPGALEEHVLGRRDEDDNAARHVGVYALYDWCWGGDDQWLYSSTDEFSVHSHDHGHYWPNGPEWTEASLAASVGEAHQQSTPTGGLSNEALSTIADTISNVTRSQLASILKKIPPGWPVTQEELECLGWFLESRAVGVADRLKALITETEEEAGQ